LAVIAIIALAGCLMVACGGNGGGGGGGGDSGGGWNGGAIDNPSDNPYNPPSGGQRPQDVYASIEGLNAEYVFIYAGSNSVKDATLTPSKITGATGLKWTIGDTNVAIFDDPENPGVLTTDGLAGVKIKTQNQTSTPMSTTLTVEPVLASGFKIGPKSVLTISIKAYRNLEIEKIEIVKSTLPAASTVYYDTDISESATIWAPYRLLKNEWKDVKVDVTSYNITDNGNKARFSLDSSLFNVTGSITAGNKGAVLITVTDTQSSKADDFSINWITDGVNYLSYSPAPKALPWGLIESGDADGAFADVFVIASWDNDRRSTANTAGVTISSGVEYIPYATFTTASAPFGTNATATWGTPAFSTTPTVATSFKRVLTYGPASFGATDTSLTATIPVSIITPTLTVTPDSMALTIVTGTSATVTDIVGSVSSSIASVLGIGSTAWSVTASYGVPLNFSTALTASSYYSTTTISKPATASWFSGGTAAATSGTPVLNEAMSVRFTFPANNTTNYYDFSVEFVDQ